MNTLDVLAIIEGNNKEIDSFSFHSFPQQKLVQEQVVEWGELDQKHFDLAMDVRNELHLPFWDAVMVTAFNNPSYSQQILRAALHHNHPQSVFFIKSKDIQSLLLNCKERIAVCSSVVMKNKQIKHIPMLDFHIPVCDVNLKIVECVCRILNLGAGYILNSGESYHFISSSVVSWDELYSILSKALRFCPIIDRAWISHQLEEKSCSLRVDKKNGVEPIVVKVIDEETVK
jgi:hypothetical protein